MKLNLKKFTFATIFFLQGLAYGQVSNQFNIEVNRNRNVGQSEFSAGLNQIADQGGTLFNEFSFNTLSTILNSFQQLNEQVKFNQRSTRLKVVTYNTALLDAFYYGIPYFDQRSYILPAKLSDLDADVIFLQEVFYEQGKSRIIDFLAAKYWAFSGIYSGHGLVILIKKSLIGNVDQKVEYLFPTQRTAETIAGYQKGCLGLKFSITNSKTPIYLVNCHLTGMLDQFEIRESQIQELVHNLLAPIFRAPEGLLVVGGDLNGSPYYNEQSIAQQDGVNQDIPWEQLSKVYFQFLNLFSGIDTFASFKGDVEMTDDSELWATINRKNHLLGQSPSASEDPDQRVDFVFVRSMDQEHVLKVENAEIKLKRVYRMNRDSFEQSELSDHYLYETEFSFGPGRL